MAIRKRSRKNRRKEQRAAQAAANQTPLTYTQAQWILNKHGIDPNTVTLYEGAQITDPRVREALHVVNFEDVHNELLANGIIEDLGDGYVRLADNHKEKMAEAHPDHEEVTAKLKAAGILDPPKDQRSLVQKAKDLVSK